MKIFCERSRVTGVSSGFALFFLKKYVQTAVFDEILTSCMVQYR